MIIWEKDSCLIVGFPIQLSNRSGWNYSVFRYPFNVNQSFLMDNLSSIVFTCKTDFMECVASRTCMIPTRYNFQLSRLRNSKQLIFLLLSAAHSPLILRGSMRDFSFETKYLRRRLFKSKNRLLCTRALFFIPLRSDSSPSKLQRF